MSIAEPVREKGRRTRTHILTSAMALFARDGLEAVSVANIARDAGVFPHQITYYFGSKDGLFVHAALGSLMREALRLEPLGLRQRTPEMFRSAISRAALAMRSVPGAVQAMSISRFRPELHPVAEKHLELFFRRAQSYLEAVLLKNGWSIDRTPGVETRTFWSAVLGARLISESGYGGTPSDMDLAGILTVRA
ncbi:TetR family transcriptional regulator [Actinoplanes sp. TBRC 11911]|uniref:TetR/AcrR family transcriptional regulator C-terminal domain-containing protein n=1 Tax=Actinoplanes sp. TBRC 11911 TaxID=2729386 RepID=UPI00145E2BC2|nr:TetR/AcrR family transcriptional regulator C-terminal domain-containing protein [Actinoplanes sp. TBRC 11911]NMO51776.1 TetR family transcriptional regulator [Actinoplanes sp. TBRC 11911]